MNQVQQPLSFHQLLLSLPADYHETKVYILNELDGSLVRPVKESVYRFGTKCL